VKRQVSTNSAKEICYNKVNIYRGSDGND